MAESGNCVIVVRQDVLVQFQAIQYETNLDVNMQMEQFFQLYHCVKSVHVKLDSSDLDADSTIILSDVFKKFAADYNSPLTATGPITPKVEHQATTQSPSSLLATHDYSKGPVLTQKPATVASVSKTASVDAVIPQVLPTEQITPQALSAQADVSAAFPTDAVTLPAFSVQSSISPSKHIEHGMEETTYFETTMSEHSDNENDMIMHTTGITGQELSQSDMAGEVLLPPECISIGSNTDDMKTKRRIKHTGLGKKRGPYRSKVARGVPIVKDAILDESEMDKGMDQKPSISSVQLVESGAQDDSTSELSCEDTQNPEYKCRFCDCHFDGEERLNIHMQTHSGLKRYLCIYCEKTFTERSSMVNHKKLHLGRGACKFICDICGKRFPQRFALRRHKRTHDKKSFGHKLIQSVKIVSKKKNLETQFKTSSVEGPETKLQQAIKSKVQSINVVVLKKDITSHKGNKTSEFKCRFCDLLVYSEDNLVTHMQSHSGLRPFVCLQCGQTFTERSSMVTHKKLHLGPNAYRYECNICGRRFAKASTLVRHKRTHTGEKPFTCNICQKSYVNQYTLKTHMAKVHLKDNAKSKPSNYTTCNKGRVDVFVSPNLEPNDADNSEQKILSCDKCGKVFTWHSALVSHKVNHHGFRPYHCDVCGKTFPRKSVLKLHLFSHCNYKPHRCDECGKQCSTRSSLNWHTKIHSGVRPFYCSICGKSFKFKSDIDKHSKIHSSSREQFQCLICSKSYVTKAGLDAHNLQLHAGEDDRKPKEFKCQWCPFVCSTKNYLGKHTVTHTGQKDHMCEVCGRAFSFEYSLKRHRLMHSNVRNHQCSLCGKSFFVVFDLHRHMRMHSDERPYKCEHCEKSFKTPICLTKHRKKVHSEKLFTVYIE
ncbi:zinc finger protein 665-like isoform X1 [Gigantopelta aegis]|uniref:zinc finger protein 665-like isoform X1 n=1 Tax=Gigantopelta aegis TaxID=1735272 RepID=UPI001B88D8DD|nr:zinc finger protein 665-like isoform X1 [Gigantopelta aegis]XP_041349549.1 zinc finger protein 665-like isoform X1 [Gigantopelta aegis]